MKNGKRYPLLFLKGMAMGAADVVPGVSGGTIAFITGIYEELLGSIAKIDIEALKLLSKFQIKAFWERINGTFLLVLVSGILLSIFSLARLITFLLEAHPIPIWSFFFGLILISCFLVIKEIKEWSWKVVLGFLVGTAVAFYITIASPTQTSNELWFVFISGAIAICAMILPGISGSFILLLLGKYAYIFSAIKEMNIAVIIVFGIGCITGILTFSRGVSWLLKNYYNTVIGILAGFMIGSLNKIWPWKITTSYRMNSEGVQVPFMEKNITPAQFVEITGNDPQVLYAILLALVGIVLVIVIEKIGSRYASNGH